MHSMYDFVMLSLASRESTFQLQKENNLGGGPGFRSTEPDWSSSDLITYLLTSGRVIWDSSEIENAIFSDRS